jgi:LacI family transcriptional regulator
MKAGIKDVARVSEAPISAVSLILNGKAHRYSKKTEDRVRRAAQQLGYRPRAYAQSMRTGVFNQVTVLSGSDIGYLGALHLGLFDALKAKSLRMENAYLPLHENPSPEELASHFDGMAADGMIVLLGREGPQFIPELLAQQRIPYVWVNEDLQWNSVSLQDYEGSCWATEALIQKGHRRIAYLEPKTGKSPHSSVQARRQGYLDAVQTAGLSPQVFSHHGEKESAAELGAILGEAVWSSPERPTAFICYSYKATWHLVLLGLQKGLKPFDDFVTVGFGSRPYIDDFGMELPYLKIPFREMGFAAVELLSELIEQKSERLPARSLELIPVHFDRIL